MKKLVLVLLAVVLLSCACGRTQETSAPVVSAQPTIASSETTPVNRTVRISATEMLADASVFETLCARFEQKTGYRTELSVNTDNVAISVAETGKMDILIAQKGTDSSRFLTAGYAQDAYEWLSDSLVLAGPANDPADVSSAGTVSQAMVRIAKTGSAFVSRYDNSDISRLETRLWADAGILIGNGKRWYKAARMSMAPSLRMASETGAYILSDKETFRQLEDELALTVFMQDVPALQTTYCVFPLSVERFPTVNSEGVTAFLSFLRSKQTQDFLRSYGTDSFGSPLYTVYHF